MPQLTTFRNGRYETGKSSIGGHGGVFEDTLPASQTAWPSSPKDDHALNKKLFF
jgi:hypothetical protein